MACAAERCVRILPLLMKRSLSEYYAGWVNSHGVEAILLDGDGRVVNRYDSILWNTSEILADFTRLVKESV